MKKFLLGFGIFLFLLLGALIALPYFFKDTIIAAVKTAANENLTATLDFKDVDISAFRHFPKLSVGLEGLDITGQGDFEGVKLVRCEQLDVAVDLWQAIFGGNVVIKGLYFEKPDIHVYVLKDGRANYDITKPTPEEPAATSTASEGSPIKLEHYAIHEGKVVYDDRSLDMLLELEGLEHEGSGEFTADLYDFTMKTGIEKMSVNYGGMQYLRNARADWDAVLGADMKNMKFTLKGNKLKINDLEILADGWTQLPNDTDILMDLKFGTPQNTFKSLLSIVPGAYTKDFGAVQANGNIQLGGFVKGKYNEKTYPAFRFDFKVGNADFKYPALPLGVSGINVDATINSPTQRLNDMTVNIPKFSLNIGSNPLSGYFHLKTPETDPNIDTKISGTLNLGELTKAFPVEGVQELNGILKADVVAKAAMSQIDRQQYEQVQMAGNFSLSNFNYRASGTPAVKINALDAGLSPQKLDLRQFDARLGRSDLRATGQIDNLLAYFSTTKTMTGNLSFNSGYFDANEWMTPEPTPEAGKIPSDIPATGTSTASTASEAVFDRWDFKLDGKIGKLKYDVYDLSNLNLQGHFTPNRMEVANFGLNIGQSDLSGNGRIVNAWNYLFNNQTVGGDINLKSSLFDLNQFMTEPATTSGTASTAATPAATAEIIPVPENMDMTIRADFAKVLYTNLSLENLNGTIKVKDRAATLQDCVASTLGGQIALNGEYNTSNLAKPLFNVDMAMQDMSFAQSYQSFATMKTFAPIMQFMNGKFNTTLSMQGVLGKDMTPDFNSLSAAGFLETIAASLSNLKALNEIGDRLGVDYLKKMDIGTTKNWIEIKNGALEVKPFDLKAKDVALRIGGSHSLTNEMNYQIVAKVPRKSLEKNAAGSAANSGLNWLSKEASKIGVSVAQGEFINMRFDITGSMLSPKIATKVLGTDGQSTIQDEAKTTLDATVNKAKDSLGNVANRELDKAKEKAAAALDKASDSLRKVANKELDKAKEKAVQEVKDKAGEVIGKEVGDKVGEKIGEKAGEKAGQVLGDQGQKKVEDVKKKIEGWDPFKKKKN